MKERLIDFDSRVATLLPETYRLLQTCNLAIHPQVFRITLHGSRGLAGGCRPDSDIDLSMLVDTGGISDKLELAGLMEDVLQMILTDWNLSATHLRIADFGGSGNFTILKHEHEPARLIGGWAAAFKR